MFMGTVLVTCFLIIIGCTGCQENKATAPIPKPKPLNIIVILDTSNRIDEQLHPGQAENDVTIAKTIVNYNHELARKLIFGSYNWIAFAVPEQPNTERIPLEIRRKLKIRPAKRDLNSGAAKLDPMRDELFSGIEELYKFVAEQDTFTGSDIWRWFKKSADLYLEKDMQNYIVCVSDGYLKFDNDIERNRRREGNKANYMPHDQIATLRDDSNWKETFYNKGYGLLEIGRDFTDYDVEFPMVEIAVSHMLDFDILKEYWQTWLKSMGISNTQFLETQDDPDFVNDEIHEFLFGRNRS